MSDMDKIKSKHPVSANVLRLNPHLVGSFNNSVASMVKGKFSKGSVKTEKRVRQGKDELNKLELRWEAYQKALNPNVELIPQSWRVKIASGSWYKIDFVEPAGGDNRGWAGHEIKGPRVMKNQQSRQLLALKVAAHQWPQIAWFLWWEDGEKNKWKMQRIFP